MAKRIAGILLFILGIVGLFFTWLLGLAHGSVSLFERGAWLVASIGLLAIGFKALSGPKK